MNCYDIADSIGYTVNSASKVLGDVRRAGYVERRDAEKRENVKYEYKLKTNVSIK